MIRRVLFFWVLASTAAVGQPLTQAENQAMYEHHLKNGLDAVMNIQMAVHCGVVPAANGTVAGFYFEKDISNASIQYQIYVGRRKIEAMFATARAEADTRATPEFCAAFLADPERTAQTKEVVLGLMARSALPD